MGKINIEETATELFMAREKRFNCPQTTLLTVAKYYGIDNDQLRLITKPFGGGLCRSFKYVCGAVSGGTMAIGLLFPEDPSVQGKELLDYVEGKYGTVYCPKILKLAPYEDPEKVDVVTEQRRRDNCLPIIIDICNWIVMKKGEKL